MSSALGTLSTRDKRGFARGFCGPHRTLFMFVTKTYPLHSLLLKLSLFGNID